jgi:hypothetical protein
MTKSPVACLYVSLSAAHCLLPTTYCPPIVRGLMPLAPMHFEQVICWNDGHFARVRAKHGVPHGMCGTPT